MICSTSQGPHIIVSTSYFNIIVSTSQLYVGPLSHVHQLFVGEVMM
jgi:hypothetical protein